MKKLIMLSFCVALVNTAWAGPLLGPNPHDNQVRICHFSGAMHDQDFVVFNQSPGARNPVCDREGGKAIFVSQKACEKGHNAKQRFRGKDCSSRP